jgi:hypothetical protein
MHEDSWFNSQKGKRFSLLQKRLARFCRPSQFPIERVPGAQWSNVSSRLQENTRMILGQNDTDELAFKGKNV